MEAGRQAHRAESQASRSTEAAPSRAAHQYGPKIRASMCSALSAANRWRGTCPAQTLRHPTGPQKKGTNSELISVTLFLRCRVLCEYFFRAYVTNCHCPIVCLQQLLWIFLHCYCSVSACECPPSSAFGCRCVGAVQAKKQQNSKPGQDRTRSKGGVKNCR